MVWMKHQNITKMSRLKYDRHKVVC